MRPIRKARGLCLVCYYELKAELTPNESGSTGRYPAEPTTALPGTEEKIRVMRERAARREKLFHPEDA